MTNSLKSKAFLGVGWNALGRFSTQGVNFVLQIILARLLSPSDYGIVAMVAIFLQIAAVFVDSGFAKALVQKQDCEEKDYSTVFYYNLIISLIFYGILFALAPCVASFYKIEQLTQVMRVASLVVIINALSIVQRTKLEKDIDFKSQSIVSFASAALSGILGIIMAYYGFGVWSLCAQSIFNSVFQFAFYFFIVRWHPHLIFSKESFNEMFSFGSKILVANIISVVYNNLYTIVIGKKFSSKDLGCYSRADRFADFPSSNISSIISGVAFPTLSKIQNNDIKLLYAYRKIIKYSSAIIFPLMVGLSALAEPFINVILGDKWAESIPYLRVLCYAMMWNHLSSLNLNLLYVKGRSDLVLKLEVIKKTIAITILFFTIPFGITVMCYGRVIYDIVAFCINASYTKKLVGLSLIKQILDFMPYLLLSLCMGIVVFSLCSSLMVTPIMTLLIGFVAGSFFYTLGSCLLFPEIRYEFNRLFHSIIKIS